MLIPIQVNACPCSQNLALETCSNDIWVTPHKFIAHNKPNYQESLVVDLNEHDLVHSSTFQQYIMFAVIKKSLISF